MASDEHGIPVPFTGVAGESETLWERRDRLNREARDIVRRLADWHVTDDAESVCAISADAAKLWAKMKRDAKGGGDVG